MYNASQEYINAVRADFRCWKSRLIFREFTLYNVDGISYTGGSQSAEGITVGAVIAPGVSITLTELDRELSGLSFTWELGVLPDIDKFTGVNPPEDFEYIPMGKFKVRSVKKNGLKYELDCVHKLAQSDVIHKTALAFPTTAQALMREVANSLELTFSQQLSPTILIEGIPDGATKRDIMGWIAALYGGFVCADRADEIHIKWYTDSGYTVPPNAVSSPEIGEQQTTYTAVSCVVSESRTYTHGEGTAMSFECPFMTAAQFEIVAKQLTGYTYRPCKLTYLLGDPLIDPWDIVHLFYENAEYIIPAANITLEHKGGVTGTLEATDGESMTEGRVDPISRAVNRLVKLINEGRSDIQKDIEDAIREATESIRGGARGFFYIIEEDGVNKETIWCDNADPSKATHGIRINSEGVGFWVHDPTDPESSLFHGPYTQAWTMDGTLIADFIRAGTLRGIRIECDSGLIAGWSVTEDSLISPDGSIKLESTAVEPMTTHKWLREQGFTHKMLRELTNREIRYLQKRIVGTSQITSSSGEYDMVIKSAEAWILHDGVPRTKIDEGGQRFYDENGVYLGFVGTNRNTEAKGLVFDLEYGGDFISWGIMESPTSEYYMEIFNYYRHSDVFTFWRLVELDRGLYVPNDQLIDIYSPIRMNGWGIVDSQFISSSDERLKRDIQRCEEDCLAVINALELIQFNWEKDGRHEKIGFSAQQAGEVSLDLQGVHDGYYTVNEGRLIRYLVGAVQQLTSEMEDLKCRLNSKR